MARVIGLILGVLTIGVLLLWFGQRRLIYFPFGDVPSPAEAGLARAEPVAFQTGDGLRLAGWFVPAIEPATGDTMIVFNGNAGNRAYRADIAARMSELGVAVLLFDYRGYGGNPGAPTEEGLARDARAALAFVESRPDVDRRRIVFFGESLGAAVAVGLAVERRPRALILRSPFTSLADTARHHYPLLPVGWLLRDRFPSRDRIAKAAVPLLVITAARDSVVPSEQSRRLFDAAPEPKRLLVIDGVDHNDAALAAGPQVVAAVGEFLRSAG
ncbi:MAG TPA: alpha/beta hydrolase [Vicinamibacterales bacterium]|jgi:fermentation-respiration switch protein FrsA (DUF1100 family)